ncbi:hypothetical protein HK102_012362, partial [Quaeritorhiza haematococci]
MPPKTAIGALAVALVALLTQCIAAPTLSRSSTDHDGGSVLTRRASDGNGADVPQFAAQVVSEPVEGSDVVFYVGKDRKTTFLVGTDKTTSSGGFQFYNPTSTNKPPILRQPLGRTKSVGIFYDFPLSPSSSSKSDIIASFNTYENAVRFHTIDVDEESGSGVPLDVKVKVKDVTAREIKIWEDIGPICTYVRKEDGVPFLFVLGKTSFSQWVVRGVEGGKVDAVRVRRWPRKSITDPSFCVADESQNLVFFGEGQGGLYTFSADPSIPNPEHTQIPIDSTFVDGSVRGVALYRSTSTSTSTSNSGYLLVSSEDAEKIAVLQREPPHNPLGAFTIEGVAKTDQIAVSNVDLGGSFGGGVIGFMAEDEDDVKTYRVLGWKVVADALGLGVGGVEGGYDPRATDSSRATANHANVSTGTRAKRVQTSYVKTAVQATENALVPTRANASRNGRAKSVRWLKLVRWGKLGMWGRDDGDDPAIWVHPKNPSKSLIITATKSDGDSGLHIFDLSSRLLQFLPGGNPNNVDILYNVNLNTNTNTKKKAVVDLVGASLRDDNTIGLWTINPDTRELSVLGKIPMPSKKKKVYGFCHYRDLETGKVYPIVTTKQGEVLQFELGAGEGEGEGGNVNVNATL